MNIEKILLSDKTIFTVKDLELILWKSSQVVRNFLNRNKNLFENIHYGLWVIKWRWYDKFELWAKLRKKSYISFETALQYYWVIFQDYSNTITLAWDNTFSKTIDGSKYIFRKLSDDILLNPIWLINKKNYLIASRERAICDMIYLRSWFYFDNIDWVDKTKLENISKIYNKRTTLEIQNIVKNVGQENA